MPVLAAHLQGWIAVLRSVPATDYAIALAALLLIRLCTRLGMWVYALIALPGTFAHELAHYLCALLLRAQPTFPSLVPERTAQGWRLGSVKFRAGMLRSVPIALAPFLLFPLALVWLVVFLAPASGPMLFVHAWIVGALLSACLPSRADFRIAFPALAIIAVLALLAWLAYR